MKDNKVARLAAVPLFASADKKALNDLASVVDTVDVDAGHVIFREGRPNSEAFIIEDGSAEVLVGDQVVAEIPAGEIIGEIALLTRSPSSATVRAKTAMTLLVLPHNRFDQVLNDAPGIALAMAKELALRLQATDKRLH